MLAETSAISATTAARFSIAAETTLACCTPVDKSRGESASVFSEASFARRMRSFSSASERRVYTGRSTEGSPGRNATGAAPAFARAAAAFDSPCHASAERSISPAARPAWAASSKPAPDTAHRLSSTMAPKGSKVSRYFTKASPRIVKSPTRSGSFASWSATHSHAIAAFTTASVVRREISESEISNSAGYTSLRMASAATSTWPRTPSAQARHATASSVETPYSGTSSAEAAPLAVAMQMRTPVKLPGPRPHTTAATSLLDTPASASVASTSFKRMVLLARCAGISRHASGTMPNVGFSGSPPGASVYIPTPTATTSFAVSNAKMHAPRAADSFCMLKVHAPFMAARCREFIPYIKRTSILPSPWRRGGSSPSIQRIARRPRPRAILSSYQNGGLLFSESAAQLSHSRPKRFPG